MGEISESEEEKGNTQDGSRNEPDSDSASSVSLLEGSKGGSSPNDPQSTSMDDNQEVKYK